MVPLTIVRQLPNQCRDHAATIGNSGQEKSPGDFSQGLDSFGFFGSSTWARTRDLRINSPALYQLSYRGTSLKLYTEVCPLFAVWGTKSANIVKGLLWVARLAVA